jgi:formamidopyrimidine-DNA glycosylase
MPELPEVESVRRGLLRARLRAPVRSVWRSKENLRIGAHWRRANEQLELLRGATPGTVKRRGKYLLWHMQAEQQVNPGHEGSGSGRDRGEVNPGHGGSGSGRDRGEVVLLIHLGMSGRCGVARPDQPRVAHTHLVLDFADDRELRFVDPRRFGGLRAGTVEAIYGSEPISSLGPEPLDRGFDGATLEQALGRSDRALRDALLDQRAVAGIGNIYALEACFDARLHPLLPARRLSSAAWQRLADALQAGLRRGIDNGGTTLKDFRNVTGEVGRNQDDLRVYGRSGEPCPVCASVLVAFMHQGRSGVFCGSCQARPRTRRVP